MWAFQIFCKIVNNLFSVQFSRLAKGQGKKISSFSVLWFRLVSTRYFKSLLCSSSYEEGREPTYWIVLEGLSGSWVWSKLCVVQWLLSTLFGYVPRRLSKENRYYYPIQWGCRVHNTSYICSLDVWSKSGWRVLLLYSSGFCRLLLMWSLENQVPYCLVTASVKYLWLQLNPVW